jgi:predicted dehydrogenase
MEAARAIVRKANDTGVLHMVSQNRRYQTSTQTLKQVLDSGQMGQVGSVTVEFFKGPHFGGFREEMAYPLIIDMAIHHFDLMRFFLDSNPISIFGQSWNPIWSWFKGDASANLLLEFANQVKVAYNGSWCSPGRETAWNAHWRFECEKGVAVLEEDQVYTQLTGEEAVAVAPVEMVYQDQAYTLHEFYEAVTKGRTPVTTCQDNIKSLAIVFNAVKSFETGEVVRFEDEEMRRLGA